MVHFFTHRLLRPSRAVFSAGLTLSLENADAQIAPMQASHPVSADIQETSHPSFQKCKKSSAFSRAGLTLLEMVVAVGIIMIISAVVVVGQSRFNNSVILTNTAYEVALAVRQAQEYAARIKYSGGATYDQGYGVHFSSASNSSFTLFADQCTLQFGTDVCVGGSGYEEYNEQSGERVSSFTLGRGIRISRFCATSSSGETCYQFSPVAGGSISYLDIMFFRPLLSACIRTDANPATGGPRRCSTNVIYSTSRIYLIAPDGNERQVIVNASGQIDID